MRALLIGIGGAGSRIVNLLSIHETKSSVKSIRSYVFDADPEVLNTMTAVDTDKRIRLSPASVETSDCQNGADFDISHIAGYFNDTTADEADAVFICAGLGGRMAEAIPGILRQLNSAFSDPVYTILTLPARNEGARISARAAASLAEIRKEARASILFDNETWLQRLEEEKRSIFAKKAEKGKDGADKAFQMVKLSVSDVTAELNELLTRRIELLLRAGEITPDGLETAEVVLDAGEVLNTLSNSDIVSIGYAAERLPKHLLGFLNRFRMEKYLLEEGHKRTARIVELAKQAVYEEVSIPCDLTTADKALVLITGPSDELSMKGFQTIRKWIDRSIKGLEMRAGDYPVHSTRDVGVIIVLAGIENVPRIAELNEIRTSYEEELGKKYQGINDQPEKGPEPEIRSATDKEIFEEGEVLSICSDIPFLETSSAASFPAIAAAAGSAEGMNNAAEDADSDLFSSDTWEIPAKSSSAETAPAAEQTPAAAPAEDSGDEIFEEHSSSDASGKEEDIFEENPVQGKAEEEDVFEENPAFVNQRYTAGTAPAYTENPLMPDTPPVSRPRRPDPQIFVGGQKKRKTDDENVISLPKRNKQPDMVLAGQADLGMRKITKDAEDRVSPGSGQRPKETDAGISVGSGQRPKETDGQATLRGKQSPKELDSGSSLRGKQSPKELDSGAVIRAGRRPNDNDGAVRLGSGQRPKEIGGTVRLGSGQRPKEIGGTIRVSAGSRPKEIGNSIKVAPRQKAQDDQEARVIEKSKETNEEIKGSSSHNIQWK